jgi:chromosome segregation ATPase
MPPPVRSGPAEVEIIRLKRDLQRAKEVIETLQSELKGAEIRLAESENNLYDCREELRRARQDLQKIEQITSVRVKEAIENERASMIDSFTVSENLRKEASDAKFKRDYFEKQLEVKEQEIEMYKNDLQKLGGEMALRRTQEEVRNSKYESAQQKRSLKEFMDQCKRLEANVQDLVAENTLLRQMAGVGSNFGIKIEDIKLLENQTVQQYRARNDF